MEPHHRLTHRQGAEGSAAGGGSADCPCKACATIGSMTTQGNAEGLDMPQGASDEHETMHITVTGRRELIGDDRWIQLNALLDDLSAEGIDANFSFHESSPLDRWPYLEHVTLTVTSSVADGLVSTAIASATTAAVSWARQRIRMEDGPIGTPAPTPPHKVAFTMLDRNRDIVRQFDVTADDVKDV